MRTNDMYTFDGPHPEATCTKCHRRPAVVARDDGLFCSHCWEQRPLNSKDIADILADPATSRWLHNAIWTLIERDPVDALHDARLLLRVAESRAREMGLID